MARVPVNVITVSPPNLDRTGFLSLEMGIGRQDGPTRRDWLLDRFEEGFQVRMLRPPLKGFVEFAPGRVSWKPLIGGAGCIVVQSLCVKSRVDWSEALWHLPLVDILENVEGNEGPVWAASFGAVESRRIRVVITGAPHRLSRLWEIEFYGPVEGED